MSVNPKRKMVQHLAVCKIHGSAARCSETGQVSAFYGYYPSKYNASRYAEVPKGLISYILDTNHRIGVHIERHVGITLSAVSRGCRST